jgi:homoserine kinase
VGTYLNELDLKDMSWKEIPLSEVLPEPAGRLDTGIKPPQPPIDIGHFRKFQWAKEIKAIAIIPDFQVPTAKAREVLPEKYSRADVVSVYLQYNALSSADFHARYSTSSASLYSQQLLGPLHRTRT